MFVLLLVAIFLIALWRIGSALQRLAPQPPSTPVEPGFGDKVIPLPVCFAILFTVLVVGTAFATLGEPTSGAAVSNAAPRNTSQCKAAYEEALSAGERVRLSIRHLRVLGEGQLLPNECEVCDEIEAQIERVEQAIRLAIAHDFDDVYVRAVNAEAAKYEPLNQRFQIVCARVRQRVEQSQ